MTRKAMTKVGERGLTKDELTEKAKLVKELQQCLDHINEASKPYNDAVEQYNALVKTVKEFIAEIGQTAETYCESRGEKWPDKSDRAHAFEGYRDQWKGFGLEEIELVDLDNSQEQVTAFEGLPPSCDYVSEGVSRFSITRARYR